jgi:hypothetical protein
MGGASAAGPLESGHFTLFVWSALVALLRQSGPLPCPVSFRVSMENREVTTKQALSFSLKTQYYGCGWYVTQTRLRAWDGSFLSAVTFTCAYRTFFCSSLPLLNLLLLSYS